MEKATIFFLLGYIQEILKTSANETVTAFYFSGFLLFFGIFVLWIIRASPETRKSIALGSLGFALFLGFLLYMR